MSPRSVSRGWSRESSQEGCTLPDFPRATTESQLREWRLGQPSAERLAAALLHLDGFENIDPQAPLGGPDGRKDILCNKSDTTYVAAAYFPTKDSTFSEIKKKFEHDIEGSISHNRRGFIFITNQHLGLTDRTVLEGAAGAKGKIAILYHRERIRGSLDSPAGYGVRLEFLKISMNESEQFAYFSSSEKRLEYALERHSREIQNLVRRIDFMREGQDFAMQTIYRVATRLGENVPPPPNTKASEVTITQAMERGLPLSASLSIPLLLFVHRLICTDMPFGMLGKLRDTTVWLGVAGTEFQDATLVPPLPEEVHGRLSTLLDDWNARVSDIAGLGDDAKFDALARFHYDFVWIHPFLDGNGRVARAILIQHCIDIFGQVDPSLLDRGTEYYSALRKADEGDFESLKKLIEKAVSG